MDEVTIDSKYERMCICGHPEVAHDQEGCFAGECYCVEFVDEKYLGKEIYLHEDFHDGVNREE